MQKNVLWIILLTLIALAAFWYVLRASLAVVSFYQYSVQVPVQVTSWSVEEKKSDQFAVMCHFSYQANGEVCEGVGKVGELYPNPWAAERAQKKMSTLHWAAWVNPSHPKRAVLEKKFPYKQALSAAVLIGLFIYFLLLALYTKLKN